MEAKFELECRDPLPQLRLAERQPPRAARGAAVGLRLAANGEPDITFVSIEEVRALQQYGRCELTDTSGYGPNHLGLCPTALPQHEMALFSSRNEHLEQHPPAIRRRGRQGLLGLGI